MAGPVLGVAAHAVSNPVRVHNGFTTNVVLIIERNARRVACSAEPGQDARTGQSQDELSNTGVGGLSGVCRACGCQYTSSVDPSTKRTAWRCICPSATEANCVIHAPGGAAATVEAPKGPVGGGVTSAGRASETETVAE